MAGNAHQRRNADGQSCNANLRRGIERNRAVFHIDEKGIEAARVRDHGDLGGTREPRCHAQHDLAARKSFLHAICEGHDNDAQLR
jgi:hypothetical protein